MRDPLIDRSKGVLIFLVVWGHFLERLVGWGIDESRILLTTIYAIHMPAFIFISGMLFKNKNIVDKIIYFLSLLIPFQLFYLLFNYAFTGQWSTAWWYQPYWILWYLFGMICWSLLLPVILKTKYPLLVSMLLAVLVGFSPINNYILSIGRVFTFLPFFVLGHLYGKDLLGWLKRNPKLNILGFIVICVIALIFAFFPISSAWLYGSYSFNQLHVYGLAAVGMRVGLMLLSTIGCLALLALVPNTESKYMLQLGQNTLAVYLLHGFVVIIIANSLSLPGSFELKILLCFLLSVVTCYLFQQHIFSHMIDKITKLFRWNKST